MILKNKIISKNIYLNSLKDSDISNKYITWLNDISINKFLETRHSIHTHDSVSRFINTCNKSKNIYLLGIFSLDNNVHIGNIKLGPIKIEHELASISLFIGQKEFWGKGISIEAIKILSNYAFNVLNLNKVVAGMYLQNIKSLKAFQKVGFKKEGLRLKHYKLDGKYEDVIQLGLLKNEFKK